jgi:hypothetical protein
MCGKSYLHQSTLCHHQRNCPNHITVANKKNENLHGSTTENHNNTTTTTGDNSAVNNNVNNITNNNNITINNFGSEDISYLTPEFIEKCTCYLANGVQSMAKAIHLNVHHPENHTVKVTNVKSPFMPVMFHEKWILKDKKQVLRQLIEKIADILKCYFDDNRDDIKQKYNSYKRDAIEFYHERLENDDKELWKILMKDIYLLFVNHRDIFEKKSVG